MSNERITENIVRNKLRELGYYDNDRIIVEEQTSQYELVDNLLRGASKTGSGHKGSPEFIITSTETPDFIVIIECKFDTNNHASENLDQPKDFAVDGALHYARFLSSDFNVIAVGISGNTPSQLMVSNYIIPKGSFEHNVLTNKSGRAVDRIVSLDDYIQFGSYDPEVAQRRHDDLMSFSRELHEFMRDHAKLTESEKPLLVSGTLIALRNEPFARTYHLLDPQKLQKQWLKVIRDEFEEAEIPNAKVNAMTQPYSSISVHPELGKSTDRFPHGVLHELIRKLNEKVFPYISIYHDFDIVGQFYGEFLKYTGGDKKSLGIVLTPRHITRFFSQLVNINKNDKVLDICAGTGGFLISAMYEMIKQTNTSEEIDRIKRDQLVGVEQQPNMYALASSNMILRGDGKANSYQGDCFSDEVTEQARSHACNIGMINPPYSQGDDSLNELYFVKHMLDCLVPGGIGVAIVPMSCAISPHESREEILRHHTLDAVLSMPDDLFYPVGVVTCIMIFKAHIPHSQSDKKTWFGYCKDDGFIKTKHLGRVDLHKDWSNISERWVNAYRNQEEIVGLSVKKDVTADDEWCAEAYMKTDYSNLTPDDLETELKKLISYRFLNDVDENEVN